MIELKDITVSKGGRKLFENFSFRIKPGENWLIQGDNGSGKTTLLQLIAGALHPFSGKVRYSFIKGSDWHTLYQQRKEKIHFIPTDFLQTFLNGFDTLFYQQRYYTMDNTKLPKVKDVFGEDLPKLRNFEFSERFDIRALLDLDLIRLSNGQLKKVLILSHLIRNIPNFLLLDYPFEGLDQESRRDLSDFTDAISQKFNIQIILVNHDQSFPTVINRRLILNKFKIETMEEVSGQGAFPSFVNVETKNKITNSSNRPPVVEMKNLTIQYGEKKVIENLDWRINQGERWALTGRNGSGKTTLFSLIFADHPMAYSQKVYLFGKRRGSGESIWDIKKKINYLGPEQIHFLNPKGIMASGRQYISARGQTKPERLNELIDFFHARDFIDYPVRILSSGQLQILLLMNFFLHDKELLLLDEPFQFLDPRNHQRTNRYLNYLLDKEVTLVLITHNENDVREWTNYRKIL